MAPSLPVAQAKRSGWGQEGSHLSSLSTQLSLLPVQAMTTISHLDTCPWLLTDPPVPRPEAALENTTQNTIPDLRTSILFLHQGLAIPSSENTAPTYPGL